MVLMLSMSSITLTAVANCTKGSSGIAIQFLLAVDCWNTAGVEFSYDDIRLRPVTYRRRNQVLTLPY